MFTHRSVLRTGLWMALVPAVLLVAETRVSAQKLRGPVTGGTPILLPRFPSAMLNNGSLQTTQNPNANLPGQVPFIFIAAMPLGDRLGRNGVYYDTDLLPNIGLFQGGQNLMGQVPQNPNNNPNPNPNPFPPPLPPVQAARMARQRMMMAMYSAYMQQAMYQQAMYQQMQYASGLGSIQQAAMQGYGDPSGLSSSERLQLV